MNNDELTIRSFLNELFSQTGGNSEEVASMYEIGETVGLDKKSAGSLAEELMVQGLLDLKTLSGGIIITTEGMALLGVSAPNQVGQTDSAQLSGNHLVDDDDRKLISEMILEIQEACPNSELKYEQIEAVVLDLKTIDLHLLSPQPKNAVVKALFTSIIETLNGGSDPTIVTKISQLIE